MERGKVKCHKYWPKKTDEIQVWGNFQIKNVGETVTEEHFIRQKLELSYQSQTRTVYHYKFTQVRLLLPVQLPVDNVEVQNLNMFLFSGPTSEFQNRQKCCSIFKIKLINFILK